MKNTRYSETQIIKILQEAESGMSVADVCRKHNCSEQSFYRWKAKFGGMEVNEAKRLRESGEDDNHLGKALLNCHYQNRYLIEVLREPGQAASSIKKIVFGLPPGADRQGPAIRHGLAGVEDQVHQDLLELVSVAVDQRQVLIENGLDLDMVQLELVVDDRHGVGDDLVERGRLEHGLLLTRELHQVLDDHPLALVKGDTGLPAGIGQAIVLRQLVLFGAKIDLPIEQ